MRERRDIIFLLFISVVVILSIVYFSVPERALFIENQIKWWSEFWEVMKKVFS